MAVKQLDRFLETLQILNNWLLKAWLKWIRCLDLVYKNYRSSYIKELLNLSCSLFEEEVSSHIGYYVVELVWNIDSWPRAAGNTVYYDVIWYFTSPIPGCQPNQPILSSLSESTDEESISCYFCLQGNWYMSEWLLIFTRKLRCQGTFNRFVLKDSIKS